MSEDVKDATSTLKKPLLCTEWTTVIPDEGGETLSPKFYLKSVQCQFQLHVIAHNLCLDVVRTDELCITDWCFVCTVVVCQSDLRFPPPSVRERIDLEEQCIFHCYTSDADFELIRGGTMSFLVILEADRDSAEEEEGSDLSENFKSLHSLSQDFAKLLEDSRTADIKLLCGDLTLPAHGAVLSARSEVFEKMLQTDMAEKRTGSIEIPDIRPQVIKEFLRYIYTGTLPEMTVEKASQLYEAGDKYKVRSLVGECASYLGKNLAEDNACEVLALAHDHSDSELKERAIRFIMARKIPLQPEHWKEFSAQRPKLALEAVQRAYEKLSMG